MTFENKLKQVSDKIMNMAKEHVVDKRFHPIMLLVTEEVDGNACFYFVENTMEMLRAELGRPEMHKAIGTIWEDIRDTQGAKELLAVIFVGEAFLSTNQPPDRVAVSRSEQTPDMREALVMVVCTSDNTTMQHFEFMRTEHGIVFMEDEEPIDIDKEHGPYSDFYPPNARKQNQ